jgi:hypothetical protein
MLSLAYGARKSIEEEVGAMFLHPGRDNPNCQVIRNKEPLAGPFVSLTAE